MTAIRGATTVSVNEAEEIENAAAELIDEIMNRNFLGGEDIVAIIFSCTKDLTAAYPAKGARKPVEKAICILKPPVSASTSVISPQK